MYSIVRDDESWIYSFKHENKRQSSIQVFQVNVTKAIRFRNVPK